MRHDRLEHERVWDLDDRCQLPNVVFRDLLSFSVGLLARCCFDNSLIHLPRRGPPGQSAAIFFPSVFVGILCVSSGVESCPERDVEGASILHCVDVGDMGCVAKIGLPVPDQITILLLTGGSDDGEPVRQSGKAESKVRYSHCPRFRT